MFRCETKIRVRYAETDQMGFLYYGNYAQYYEVGRAEAIRTLGVTYRDMEEQAGFFMPVMSMSTRYLRPALYDDLITVVSEVRHLPERDVIFHHELFNEKGELINAGEIKLCFLDKATRKRVDAPAYLLDLLAPFFPQSDYA